MYTDNYYESLENYFIHEDLYFDGNALDKQVIEPWSVMARTVKGAIEDTIEAWEEFGPGQSIVPTDFGDVYGHLYLVKEGEKDPCAKIDVQIRKDNWAVVNGVEIL